jgi:RimJ/RimL family protein N-acetyltransferase
MDHTTGNSLRLRRARLSDGPFFGEMMRDRNILETSGLHRPIATLWFPVWWWIKKKYECLYCIEIESIRIGFIGLYNLKAGDSCEISLVIFRREHRRLGHGREAFTLFVRDLVRRMPVEKIIVRVKTENHGSLSFWTSLGFKEICEDSGDIKIMSMNLNTDDQGV